MEEGMPFIVTEPIKEALETTVDRLCYWSLVKSRLDPFYIDRIPSFMLWLRSSWSNKGKMSKIRSAIKLRSFDWRALELHSVAGEKLYHFLKTNGQILINDTLEMVLTDRHVQKNRNSHYDVGYFCQRKKNSHKNFYSLLRIAKRTRTVLGADFFFELSRNHSGSSERPLAFLWNSSPTI
ncbi:hypothetical protein CEXT_146541 [Caerostris extrusa]|uniref:Uncharacterized protein n=1 Tax=Caerostris extrusa TaxID=172846 RepID=A0AAV4RIY7_CAEEX|nr:hypothetical protein CEXT_146541 [Caerostris extrusa]